MNQFGKTYQLWMMGGMTGSGKTKLLHALEDKGEQVVDLEDLAQHQGSSYGTMNKMVQPTQEQFENNFADQLRLFNPQRRIWVEDESLTIGKIFIPNPFWHQMKEAVLINIQVGLEQRINALVQEYGELDKDFLVDCTERIHKRLGPLHTKLAVTAIRENRMTDFVRLVLVYYDKTYTTGLAKRQPEKLLTFDITDNDMSVNATKILTFTQTLSILEQV